MNILYWTILIVVSFSIGIYGAKKGWKLYQSALVSLVFSVVYHFLWRYSFK